MGIAVAVMIYALLRHRFVSGRGSPRGRVAGALRRIPDPAEHLIMADVPSSS